VLTLDDDNKSLYDIFGLSEIEKIQEQIEKDLQKTSIPPASPPPEGFSNFILVSR